MVAGSYPTKTLGKLVDIFDSKRIPVKKSDRKSGSYPYYGASGIVDCVDDWIFEGEHLLLAEDGENLKSQNTPIAFLANGKFWVNNHAHVMRGNCNNDTKYLCYALQVADIKSYLSGSTRPKLNQGDMKNIKLPSPPLPEQRAIAKILGTLDDKIELNRRINQTLEAMARAVFKSWFVDFDPVRNKAAGLDTGLPPEIADLFPASFQDSELGEIPEGWEAANIDEISEKVACGPFGSSIKVSTFVSTGVPVISGQHLNNIKLEDNSYNFITEDHAEKLKNANVYQGDLVFTHAGNIGQVSYIPETSRYDRYVLSQRQFYLRCNKDIISPEYLAHFFKSPLGQHKLLANTSSTGVPSISRPVSYLRSITLVLPPIELIDIFSSIIKPLHIFGANLANESSSLANLRDTLLPKLISGELRVPDAEKIVEEVAL